ncbi:MULTISPECIES: response regulator [Clostridium]|uniref:response regulator n=1 Tax=Clostridium TaxID=1485 RepID=UPI0008248FF3|nr:MULTISPECIES: response regulator transcription factor [Clostridium]PJI08699.1 DNA-binding response regulator [Clostridium sp. CT7]
MNKIKVLIADDQSIIRDGLKLILDMEDDIEVIGLAANGDEALSLTEKLKPDVILMDIRMPRCDGVMGTKKISGAYPDVKIIILTTFLEDDYIFEALKYGAKGYLLKDVESDKLADSIRTIVNGGVLIDPAVAAKIVTGLGNGSQSKKVESKITEELTGRETEIAKLIANGNTNKEIAKVLFISEGTVKNHVTNILSKLYLRDRTQIALYVKNHDLI